MTTRIIIAGGRDFSDYRLLKEKANKLLVMLNLSHKEVELLCGDCKGADLLGDKWATEYNVAVTYYTPQWGDVSGKPEHLIKEKNGRKYYVLAGHERNQLMVDDADIVLAFWDGKSPGTEDCLKRAREKGIPRYVVKY